jgi:Uma2 family endonuclease
MPAALNEVPPADGWTTDDLDALPDDGLRRELIDGVLHVPPSPSNIHQIIAARLVVALEQTCPGSLSVTQANDVRMSPRRSFIPDVLVITDEAAQRCDGTYVPQEVLLAVEIVSPTSTSMDRVMKPSLYAAAGIPHFWLVETAAGFTVQTYTLDPEDQVYLPTGEFTDRIVVTGPWPIDIPLDKLRPRHL